MTAEIALLNRSALALAADSAVTLRIGSSYKTYNTAEKIFEFSCRQPIALMIYNNVEYVGVPFDVIIRKHRRDCGLEFDRLTDAADEFLEYLLNFPRKPNQEGMYLAAILLDVYGEVYQKFQRIGRKALTAKATGKPIDKIFNEFDRFIDEEIEKYQSTSLAGFLQDKSLDDFIKEYGEVCEQSLKTVFKLINLKPGHKSKLIALAFHIVKSSIGSEILTGLVFGGFGTNDLFPTLHYLEIDGTYFGKLKILSRREVDIDRDGDYAEMIPFAQKEMAERFIYGIDKDLTSDIAKFISKAVDEIAAAKPGAFDEEELNAVRASVSSSFDDTIEKLIGVERQDILDIVNFMSKKELGEMAHALVELTSAKRRFSTAQETVGGPIDVAIVSRSEGFIWIRRKHYFESDANPGYFTRVFPLRSSGGIDGSKANNPRSGSRTKGSGRG